MKYLNRIREGNRGDKENEFKAFSKEIEKTNLSPRDEKNELNEETLIVMEPAALNAKPIYFEQADGKLIGPATPEFLAQVGRGDQATFWIILTINGQIRWVRSDLLRTKSGGPFR